MQTVFIKACTVYLAKEAVSQRCPGRTSTGADRGRKKERQRQRNRQDQITSSMASAEDRGISRAIPTEQAAVFAGCCFPCPGPCCCQYNVSGCLQQTGLRLLSNGEPRRARLGCLGCNSYLRRRRSAGVVAEELGLGRSCFFRDADSGFNFSVAGKNECLYCYDITRSNNCPMLNKSPTQKCNQWPSMQVPYPARKLIAPANAPISPVSEATRKENEVI